MLLALVRPPDLPNRVQGEVSAEVVFAVFPAVEHQLVTIVEVAPTRDEPILHPGNRLTPKL